jgi:hypothetical protein
LAEIENKFQTPKLERKKEKCQKLKDEKYEMESKIQNLESIKIQSHKTIVQKE